MSTTTLDPQLDPSIYRLQTRYSWIHRMHDAHFYPEVSWIVLNIYTPRKPTWHLKINAYKKGASIQKHHFWGSRLVFRRPKIKSEDFQSTITSHKPEIYWFNHLVNLIHNLPILESDWTFRLNLPIFFQRKKGEGRLGGQRVNIDMFTKFPRFRNAPINNHDPLMICHWQPAGSFL